MGKLRQFPELIPKYQNDQKITKKRQEGLCKQKFYVLRKSEKIRKIVKIIREFPQWLVRWELTKKGNVSLCKHNFYVLEKFE